MKKGIKSAISVALIAGCFAAGVFAENVKLTYMYWGSPAEDDATKKALKDFEAANPGITVEPLFSPGTKAEFDAKLKAMSESDTLPDVGYFRSESVFEYASNDFFLDLTPYVEKEGLKKEYLPQTFLVQKGKIIGAYTAAEAQVMYYNKKLLQDAGIPLPPTDYTKAWTWDQAVSYWTKLTVDKNGKHPGEAGFDPKKIVRFGVNHEVWSGMLYPAIWSNGGEVFSADGKQILIDKPETIQAIQRLADLRLKNKVMSAPGSTEYQSAGSTDPKVLMQNGQLAFYISGAWELLDYAKMNLPLGVGAIPIQKKPAQIYISGVNVVYKSSKHPAEAWKLQKWMMTPDKTLELYSGGLWMPTKASWYTSKDDLAKWLSNPAHPDGFKGSIVDSMKVAKAEPISVKNYDQIWSEYINPELDKVWTGKATAAVALKTAADKIRKSGLLQGTW
jgi:multiple sugar transport system substrate-binding protein